MSDPHGSAREVVAFDHTGAIEKSEPPTNLVQLDAYRPHEVGDARCRGCKYEFVAVILNAADEVAKTHQECPRCHEFEAAFLTYAEIATAQ